ncbi:uncharacterized protein J4E87_010340 [Alternaria ethzedia]|uniref:uncharacterized protein n=1 Tax=Alternaria ethzedia TaxID=181014 RepID=UPI0020C4F490|nr:uncharacterized protein J4E87_010340 [Alternaria ethzedia]KAI4612150.1 hypothetical protein J4E87_010340 [Alternaria ethzedia]
MTRDVDSSTASTRRSVRFSAARGISFHEPRTRRPRAKLRIPAGWTKETSEVDYLIDKGYSENSDEPEYLVRWAGVDDNGNEWPDSWGIASVIGDGSIEEYEARHAQREHEEIDVDTAAEASLEPDPFTINTARAPALPATPAVQAKKKKKKNTKDKEKQKVMKRAVQDDDDM